MAKDAADKSLPALPLKISTGIDLGRLEVRIQEAIARRAYAGFERRGRQHGSDLADWFRAEEEIQRPSNVVIREEEQGIEVKVQGPSFPASETEVGVSPQRVVIWGLKADPGSSSKSSGKPAGSGFGAFLADIDLPSPVNPVKSTASFKDDWIEVQLTKER
ncbi:MAG: DUF2934 domain-containing protein [Terriglobia bacterium]